MTTDSALDLAAFRATPLKRDPYDYVVVPNFVRPAAFSQLSADYPEIDQPGSHPPTTLRLGQHFRAFLTELEGPELRTAMAEKFHVDLAGRPTLITVRGRTRADDGKIHTDTA